MGYADNIIIMTANEIFQQAISQVDNACENQTLAFVKLDELGFDKFDLNGGKPGSRLFNDLYKFQVEDGEKVEVAHWCFDPTKSFGYRQPKIYKFEVRLVKEDIIIFRHSNSFQDLAP